jgi:hypothetical protein
MDPIVMHVRKPEATLAQILFVDRSNPDCIDQSNDRLIHSLYSSDRFQGCQSRNELSDPPETVGRSVWGLTASVWLRTYPD